MNYTNITDTHTHYHDAAFQTDMDEVLELLPQRGIYRIVNCGTDVATSLQSYELSQKYDYIYYAAGIHGLDVLNAKEEDIDKIQEIAKRNKCVAIGEIGLDYHYEAATRDLQLFYFEEQLKLANRLNLPVIIHDREAHNDTLTLLKKYQPRGVLHCFSGSTEFAKEILNLGLYIGLGGAVTFQNAKKPKEVAAMVPKECLLLETDCPYMTPVPNRGKRNTSEFIPYTAECIAALRHTEPQTLIHQTTQNANQLFGC